MTLGYNMHIGSFPDKRIFKNSLRKREMKRAAAVLDGIYMLSSKIVVTQNPLAVAVSVAQFLCCALRAWT